jgi:hypothetical protein
MFHTQSDIKVKLLSHAHHRNGICGAPFEVCIFDSIEGKDATRMVGMLFEDKGQVAVFDLAKLAAGDVAFSSNSWRGDEFEKPLRDALRDQEEVTCTL